ncbi:hypothetical protein ZHAS_00021475 [Anopheles sinensis]|uniref:Uncharacterized protein n=1 Tax=Anopheles sinensis TaxID=74873 RepID=A0A084WSH9_ANOSI|nr:hypothetical protein ZHAS_00021475 [Anopheles sinensis]
MTFDLLAPEGGTGRFWTTNVRIGAPTAFFSDNKLSQGQAFGERTCADGPFGSKKACCEPSANGNQPESQSLRQHHEYRVVDCGSFFGACFRFIEEQGSCECFRSIRKIRKDGKVVCE